MAGFDEAAFLDLLYGAAVEPDLWTSVMNTLADAVGGGSSFLSQLDFTTGLGAGMIARIDPIMPSVYVEHYAEQNVLSKAPNPSRYVEGWTPRILTDEDWIPKAEFVHTEYYNDFLKPQDVHSVLMVRLSLSAPTVSVLNLHRGRTNEQFGAAERETVARLHPHLIRAFKLSEKLSAERQLDQSTAPLFETSPHGLFLVDERGRVMLINLAGEAMVRSGTGLTLTSGRLRAEGPANSRRLEALIAAATTHDGAIRSGGSMAISSAQNRLPLGVTVSPLRRGRTTFLAPTAQCLVCVTNLEADVALPGARLAELFGLTPAEVRVAMALFGGANAREAADSLGISPNTVHIHVSRIFDKTGVKRQSELIRLMSRAVSITFE